MLTATAPPPPTAAKKRRKKPRSTAKVECYRGTLGLGVSLAVELLAKP